MIHFIEKNQLQIIQELAFKIWPICYADIISKEQIDYMLTKFYNLQSLENLFELNHQFILISENDIPLGFASFQNNAIENKTKLHKIYVLSEIKGTGLGKKLLDFIELEAKKNNQTHIFLNVNKKNDAIQFYKKTNFVIQFKEVISIGNNFVMDDFVMEKEIN